MIDVHCTCGQILEFPEEMAGQEADCPYCGRKTLVMSSALSKPGQTDMAVGTAPTPPTAERSTTAAKRGPRMVPDGRESRPYAGGTPKLVDCRQCGCKYVYCLDVARSAERDRNLEQIGLSRDAVARIAEWECDPVPCPQCGYMSPEMVRARSEHHHKALAWLGVIPLLLGLCMGFAAVLKVFRRGVSSVTREVMGMRGVRHGFSDIEMEVERQFGIIAIVLAAMGGTILIIRWILCLTWYTRTERPRLLAKARVNGLWLYDEAPQEVKEALKSTRGAAGDPGSTA